MISCNLECFLIIEWYIYTFTLFLFNLRDSLSLLRLESLISVNFIFLFIKLVLLARTLKVRLRRIVIIRIIIRHAVSMTTMKQIIIAILRAAVEKLVQTKLFAEASLRAFNITIPLIVLKSWHLSYSLVSFRARSTSNWATIWARTTTWATILLRKCCTNLFKGSQCSQANGILKWR